MQQLAPNKDLRAKDYKLNCSCYDPFDDATLTINRNRYLNKINMLRQHLFHFQARNPTNVTSAQRLLQGEMSYRHIHTCTKVLVYFYTVPS